MLLRNSLQNKRIQSLKKIKLILNVLPCLMLFNIKHGRTFKFVEKISREINKLFYTSLSIKKEAKPINDSLFDSGTDIPLIATNAF